MDKNLINKIETSIQNGLNWLVSQEKDILTITDYSAHYKAPYLYAVTGLRERSRAYADLFRQSYITSDGDLRMSDSVKGWQHLPASPGNRYIYGNGWTIAGLQKGGSYGLAQKALSFLQRFQDPKTGGFYSRYSLADETIDTSRMDTSSTCSGLLALLACGKVEEAIKAGEFLIRMISEQPEKTRFLYTTFTDDGKILTDVFHNEDATAFNGRKHFCVSTEHNALYEIVWMVGMPMKLLGLLYDLTGDKKYLESADEYHSFFHRLSEERWQNNSATKVMWGAAELYQQKGDKTYAETAERIISWLIDTQHENGVWVHSLWYRSIEEQPFQATLDLVQEYVSEFSDVIYGLSR